MAINAPLNTDITPKYQVIEYEGKTARLYPDGAIRNERGQLMAQHPNGKEYQITSANARELNARRYELAQEAVREAVMTEVQGISDIPLNTPEAAFAFVVKKQTIALIDSDKPRFDDVERLGQLMGTVERPRKQDQQQVGPPPDAVLAQLAQFAAEIVTALRPDVIPMRNENVIDAE